MAVLVGRYLELFGSHCTPEIGHTWGTLLSFPLLTTKCCSCQLPRQTCLGQYTVFSRLSPTVYIQVAGEIFIIEKYSK